MDVHVSPYREGEDRWYFGRVDLLRDGDWRAALVGAREAAAYQVAVERDSKLNPQERAALGR
jgi:hypothetical protein